MALLSRRVDLKRRLVFFEQFGQMFSVTMPSGVDSELLSSTSDLWKDYWMLPAYMAVAIAVIFFVGFWDKSKDDSEE